MGITPPFFKSYIFCNFTYLSLVYIEKKNHCFLQLYSHFMNSYILIVKALVIQIIIVILHFWVKNDVLEQNNFISQIKTIGF